jgi:DNA-3-methyladenine glycosylase II
MSAQDHSQAAEAGITISERPTYLSFSGPLDFDLTLRRYQAYGADAANRFDGTTFRKVFRYDGALYLLSIVKGTYAPVMIVHPPTDQIEIQKTAEAIARKTLGLDFSLNRFYQRIRAKDDEVMLALAERFFGLRPTLSSDLFEILVTSITAQQINLQFAFTVRSRLIRRYGDTLVWDGQKYFAFPTPEKLARARVQTLRNLQFTQRKAEYIIDLAKRICNGDLNLDSLENASEEEIHEKLTQSRGIGRWTVDWFLARGLGRGMAFPAGDLGVAKAVQHFYFDGEPQPEERLRGFAEGWGKFQNLAAHYWLAGYYIDPDCAPAPNCQVTGTICLAGTDDGGTGTAEVVTYQNTGASPQTVFIVVDGYTASSSGAYDLVINLL